MSSFIPLLQLLKAYSVLLLSVSPAHDKDCVSMLPPDVTGTDRGKIFLTNRFKLVGFQWHINRFGRALVLTVSSIRAQILNFSELDLLMLCDELLSLLVARLDGCPQLWMFAQFVALTWRWSCRSIGASCQ